jgi:hypothetical protein
MGRGHEPRRHGFEDALVVLQTKRGGEVVNAIEERVLALLDRGYCPSCEENKAMDADEIGFILGLTQEQQDSIVEFLETLYRFTLIDKETSDDSTLPRYGIRL